MSYSEIVDFIYSKLSEVKGIGKVYKYERWVVREADFINVYSVESNSNDVRKINGWEITRRAVEEEISNTGQNIIRHHFIIRGFYGVDDKNASSHEFQILIENILDKLRKACEPFQADWFLPDPPNVNFITTIMFGNYLVHSCEIEWIISELEERR